MPGSFSYDASSIATTQVYQVRRLIGDVNPTDAQLYDEEISWELTMRGGNGTGLSVSGGNLYAAAAECCRLLAAKYSRDVDLVEGELRKAYSARQKAYAARAIEMDTRAKLTGLGVPYGGGLSISDKQIQSEDSDRVPPQFSIGMFDAWLPLGPIESETDVFPPGSNDPHI